jgi:hypothetical protein
MQCTWRVEWEDPDATEKHQSGQSEGREEDPVHAPCTCRKLHQRQGRDTAKSSSGRMHRRRQPTGLRVAGLGASRPGVSSMPCCSGTAMVSATHVNGAGARSMVPDVYSMVPLLGLVPMYRGCCSGASALQTSCSRAVSSFASRGWPGASAAMQSCASGALIATAWTTEQGRWGYCPAGQEGLSSFVESCTVPQLGRSNVLHVFC